MFLLAWIIGLVFSALGFIKAVDGKYEDAIIYTFIAIVLVVFGIFTIPQ